MPLISVIIASYNHEKFLPEAIDSVLHQTMQDLELIIIDDASLDNSRHIIEQYQKSDSRIRYFVNEQNMGVAKTANRALDLARGKYIAFFSSDDVWNPTKLEEQLTILKKNDNLVVWSDAEILDPAKRVQFQLWSQMFDLKNKNVSGDIFCSLLSGNYICGQSRIQKRENIKNSRFNPTLKFLNDFLFELEMASKFSYYYIDKPLVKYRIHEKNSKYSNRDEWILDDIKLCSYVLRNYGEKLSLLNKINILRKIFVNVGFWTYFFIMRRITGSR